MRLTLPIMSMVITFFCFLLKNSAEQWNTLEILDSALPQFCGN